MRSNHLKITLRKLTKRCVTVDGLPESCFEFHISKKAREKYECDHAIFSSTGNVVFSDFRAARLLAQQINKHRDLEHFPEQSVKAGQINAMGLLDEILHHVVFLYREQINPKAFEHALGWIEAEVSEKEVDKVLTQFIEQFPPMPVFKKQLDVEAYLKESTGDISNRSIALEEMVLLWLANRNPAFSPFQELFDDALLRKQTAYLQVMQSIDDFFKTQPPFGPDNLALISLLRQPALHAPDSLEDQLKSCQNSCCLQDHGAKHGLHRFPAITRPLRWRPKSHFRHPGKQNRQCRRRLQNQQAALVRQFFP